jgi:hypothetical protein
MLFSVVFCISIFDDDKKMYKQEGDFLRTMNKDNFVLFICENIIVMLIRSSFYFSVVIQKSIAILFVIL